MRSSICGWLALATGGSVTAGAASALADAPPFIWTVALPDRASGVAVSPNGAALAAVHGFNCPGLPDSCPGRGGYSVYNAASGALLSSRSFYRASPNNAAFSPEATRLSIAVGEADLRVLSTGAAVPLADAFSGSAHHTAFSADGSRVFYGTTPGSAPALYVFDVATGEPTNDFGLVHFVAAMAVSPGGHLLAAADDTATVFVFNITNPDQEQLLYVIEDPNPTQPSDPYGATSFVQDLSFAADGTLAVMSDQQVTLWRNGNAPIATFRSPQTFDNQTSGEFFWRAALSPDGRTLAAGGWENNNTFMQSERHGLIEVWDTASGQVVGHYEDGLLGMVRDVRFAPDSGTLFTTFADDTQTWLLAAFRNANGSGHCATADFNNDGDVGTDQDIEAFFSCLAGSCCPTCPVNADFNGDGDVGTDADIEAFFRVLAGGSC